MVSCRDIAHSCVAHVKVCMTHSCLSHVKEESCHTYSWVMSPFTSDTHEWVMSHINESCHTHEWVMSHLWVSHVTLMSESCHTYEWVMSPLTSGSRLTPWVMSHYDLCCDIKLSLVLEESCHNNTTTCHTYSQLQIGWQKILRLFLKKINQPEFSPWDVRLVPMNNLVPMMIHENHDSPCTKLKLF